jgi:predicted nicotinamide N-methyase
MDPVDSRAFVIANTRVHPVPHAPEICLHLADEAVALWQKTEDDLGDIGLPPPFWAFAWAGGQALARYLLDEPGTVVGRNVYDFATGSGLAAIAAARSGAAHVTACDIDRFAIAAARLNMELNGVTFELSDEDPLDRPPPEAEVILTGDVFYEKPMATRVLAWADRALAAGSRVLVGDPGRAYLPKKRLARLAAYDVPVNRSLEDYEVKRTQVFELLPQSAA